MPAWCRPSHGAVSNATSGGSSGVPSPRAQDSPGKPVLERAAPARGIWHRDDPLGLIARVRRVPPGARRSSADLIESGAGLRLPNWGPPTQPGLGNRRDRSAGRSCADRGPGPLRCSVAARLPPQLPVKSAPAAGALPETATRIPSIRSVWTMSETVDPTMRALCREILGCPIVHNYTSAEAGYMALQCPVRRAFPCPVGGPVSRGSAA